MALHSALKAAGHEVRLRSASTIAASAGSRGLGAAAAPGAAAPVPPPSAPAANGKAS